MLRLIIKRNPWPMFILYFSPLQSYFFSLKHLPLVYGSLKNAVWLAGSNEKIFTILNLKRSWSWVSQMRRKLLCWKIKKSSYLLKVLWPFTSLIENTEYLTQNTERCGAYILYTANQEIYWELFLGTCFFGRNISVRSGMVLY